MKSMLLAVAGSALLLPGCNHIQGAIAPGSIRQLTATSLDVSSSEVERTSRIKGGAFTSKWDFWMVDGRTGKCESNDRLDPASTRCKFI